MNIEAIRAASARVTAAGQPYEVTPETIDGVTFRVFKNAPANLRELYRSSLAHGRQRLLRLSGRALLVRRIVAASRARCAAAASAPASKPATASALPRATTPSGCSRSWASRRSAQWR